MIKVSKTFSYQQLHLIQLTYKKEPDQALLSGEKRGTNLSNQSHVHSHISIHSSTPLAIIERSLCARCCAS